MRGVEGKIGSPEQRAIGTVHRLSIRTRHNQAAAAGERRGKAELIRLEGERRSRLSGMASDALQAGTSP
jgi:hypothetical protein